VTGLSIFVYNFIDSELFKKYIVGLAIFLK